MEKLFKFKENNTTAKTEILAGITTFMTMAYMIALNPNILTKFGECGGKPLWNGVFMATCISSAIGMFAMTFLANKPFCLAPGMGLNSFFSLRVCLLLRCRDYTCACNIGSSYIRGYSYGFGA